MMSSLPAYPVRLLGVGLVGVLMLTVLFASQSFAGDIVLPSPDRTGGIPVQKAIDIRASAENDKFPTGELSMEDLSTILWAASGHNRNGEKWTIPTGKWRPPYTRIYVAHPSGSYRYDWEGHKLVYLSDVDARTLIPLQDFAKNAPVALYFVGDGEDLSFFDDTPEWKEEFPLVLAGAMSQNIYLAAETVNVGARLVYSVQRDKMREQFRLRAGDQPYFAIFLGKRDSSMASSQREVQSIRIAHLTIKPEELDAFTNAVREEMRDALAKEDKVTAIYAVADKNDPTKLTFFEMYVDDAAYETHRETPHFVKYFNTTKEMISERELIQAIPVELRDKYNTPSEH